MLRKQISKLPPWIFSGLTVLLILWLTLAPDPLGDNGPDLFPGADKIVHAIMFGFLTVTGLLDYQRKREWRPAASGIILASAIASSLLGIAVEFAQLAMGMGRGFEVADMAADIAGASLCALLWSRLQRRWSVG